MELVWQSSGTAARKRTSRDKLPCQHCRSQKKRCYHTNDDDNRRTACNTGEIRKIRRIPPPPLERSQDTRSAALESSRSTRESTPSPGRVSDYNPEFLLAGLSSTSLAQARIRTVDTVTATTATNGGSSSSTAVRDAKSDAPPTVPPDQASGVEGNREKRLTQTSSIQILLSKEKRADLHRSWCNKHRKRVPNPTIAELSHHHRLYLEEVGALQELPRMTTDAFLPIYISLLDDLIPVIDGPRVFRNYSNGQCSPYLIRAICLVVCKTKQAAPFLKFEEDGPLMEPLDFGGKLLAGLDAAIKADLEPNGVTKVQILALMHLHNDGVGGMERASSHLSRAICEAWHLSLHLSIPGKTNQDQCDLLWWSLRNFDRLNKPIIAAGPFMIDDTDVSIARVMSSESSYRSQIMCVSIALGDLMKTATRIYKATSTATVDDCLEFPSLSSITKGTGFDQFQKWHRAYLEIWYHIAAMLSCRHSGPGSIPYARRVASADAILKIMSNGGHEYLPPLPLVPYALSMSTAIMYRLLRDGQRTLQETIKNLSLCCEALDSLKRRWTSAKGVSRLAKKLLSVLNESRDEQHHSATVKLQTGTRSSSDMASDEHGNTDQMMNSERPGHSIRNPKNSDSTLITEWGGVAAPQLYPPNNNMTEDHGHDHDAFQTQPTEFGPGAEAMDASSYTQLARGFQGSDGWDIANMLQDLSTWEILGCPYNEDICGSIGMNLSEYFMSPDFEATYEPRL